LQNTYIQHFFYEVLFIYTTPQVLAGHFSVKKNYNYQAYITNQNRLSYIFRMYLSTIKNAACVNKKISFVLAQFLKMRG